jgi:ankyrin repeat protein
MSVAEALFAAAASGDDDEIRALLATGSANVNDTGDRIGRTPVYMAAKHGHVGSIRVLYELGADVNKCTSGGASPVCIAAEEGHAECIRVLHDLGAAVNHCDIDGWSSAARGACPFAA